jgi:hypothetical protein
MREKKPFFILKRLNKSVTELIIINNISYILFCTRKTLQV